MSTVCRRWPRHLLFRAALAALVLATLPLLAGAQSAMGWVLKSGLHTFLDGHAAFVTVVETGSATATSQVSIEFRDAADVVRGSGGRLLARSRPVRFRVPVTTRGGEQLRVIVKLLPTADIAASEPIVTFEDHDFNHLTIEPLIPPCPLFSVQPPSGDDGQAIPNCPGLGVRAVPLPTGGQ